MLLGLIQCIVVPSNISMNIQAVLYCKDSTFVRFTFWSVESGKSKVI